MARYYIFDTEKDADEAIEKINARARTIYAAQGYTVDTDGSVIGVKASDSSVMDDATRTETWDESRKRLDGKWVVRHTEFCPGYKYPINETGITVAQYVGQDLITVPVEEEDPSWWQTPDTQI